MSAIHSSASLVQLGELSAQDAVLWCAVVCCCRIVYLPGLEEEDLNLDDIIRDGHMMLMPPRRP